MEDRKEYPADPLSAAQIQEFTLLSLKSDSLYKAYREKLCASCRSGSATPLKVQKELPICLK